MTEERKTAEAEGRATILVIDDTPQNVELMKAFLLVAGYNVVIASHRGEALQGVREDSPDLVLALVQLVESGTLSRELPAEIALFEGVAQPGGRPGLVKYDSRRVNCATTSW